MLGRQLQRPMRTVLPTIRLHKSRAADLPIDSSKQWSPLTCTCKHLILHRVGQHAALIIDTNVHEGMTANCRPYIHDMGSMRCVSQAADMNG